MRITNNNPATQAHHTDETGDTITILHSLGWGKELRKLWTRREPGHWYKRDFDQKLKWFRAETLCLNGIEDMAMLLERLQHDPMACIIRGAIAEGCDPQRIRRNTIKHHGREGFIEDFDRRWACVDLDKGDFPFEIDYQDPEIMEAAAIWARDSYLASKAPELHDVKCVAQFSSSASFNKEGTKKVWTLEPNTQIKLHLWFWLSDVVCGPSLKVWLDKMGADKSLSRCEIPHYTATPRFQDNQRRTLSDPLAWRTRLLPGTRSMVPPLPELVDSATWDMGLKEEQERQEALQVELKKQAQEHGPSAQSNDSAEQYLEQACEKITYAFKGTRHNTVYGQSYWVGRLLAGQNGLHYAQVRHALESTVNAVFRNEGSLGVELRAVEDGLKAGLAEPFYLRRTKPEEKPIPSLQPATACFANLEILRGVLSDEIKLGLSSSGTTLLVSPTGSGKTHLTKEEIHVGVAREVIHSQHRALWASPTRDTRDATAKLLREAGIPVWVVYGHDETNCASLQNYLYAQKLKQGAGRRWCRDICPFHYKRNGSCCPPTQIPPGSMVMLSTHANAAAVSAKTDLALLIWDESAQLRWHQIDASTLGAAVGREEICGETTDKLLALLSESHGRKIRPKELAEAICGLETGADLAFREQKFDDLAYKGYRPDAQPPMDWRALDALQVLVRHEGKGCYAKDGVLHLPELAFVPDIPTRLILDATATPLAAEALYGPHRWRCLKLEPNEHVTHIHININGGSRARNHDGTWACQRTGRLHKALRKHLPEALHVEFKRWLKCEELEFEQKQAGLGGENDERRERLLETTYFNGTEGRGSNRWRHLNQAVMWDFYVTQETREAHALLWEELLRKQGLESEPKRLIEEAEFQLEIAPVIQTGGRIRPYEATAENPKTLVTIGKRRRVPVLGGKYIELNWDLALFLMTGEMNYKIATLVLASIAKRRDGLWFHQLEDLNVDEILFSSQDLQLYPDSPLNLKGSPDIVASLQSQRDNILSNLKNAWRAGPEASFLRVTVSNKRGIYRYLPSAGGALSGVERRAREEDWLSWRVEDHCGRELAAQDRVVTALDGLPLEASLWKEADLVHWVTEKVGCSPRTVRHRIADLGGVDEVRGRLKKEEEKEKEAETQVNDVMPSVRLWLTQLGQMPGLQELQDFLKGETRQAEKSFANEVLVRIASLSDKFLFVEPQASVVEISRALCPQVENGEVPKQSLESHEGENALQGAESGESLTSEAEQSSVFKEAGGRNEVKRAPPEASCWPLDELKVREIEELGCGLQEELVQTYESLLKAGHFWEEAMGHCLNLLASVGYSLCEESFWSMFWWKKDLTRGFVVPWSFSMRSQP